MVLKATELGLGNLWIADTYYVHKELGEFVENVLKDTDKKNFINEDNRLICAITLGEMGEPRYNKERKSIDDILTIINYDKK